MSNSRIRRLTRELEKAKPGDEVDLRVYSGGNTKSVRVKTENARDLPGMSSFFFGDGPGARTLVLPRGQMLRSPMLPGGTTLRYRMQEPFDGARLKRQIEQSWPKIAPMARKIRASVTI
jgi:hypothetical protein